MSVAIREISGLLTVREASQMLGTSTQTIHRWIKLEKLHAIRTKLGYFLGLLEVQALVRERATTSYM